MSLTTLTNAKSKSAWDTELDLLLFSLGAPALNQAMQTYGINVLKVREVARTPDITAAPQMPRAVEGMVCMRGRLVPVVNLATYFGIAVKAMPPTMIVAEYNGQIQGLLVDAVDRIVRLPWASVKKPPALLSPEAGSLVTAVGELADGRLVMMLDVEGNSHTLPITRPFRNGSPSLAHITPLKVSAS
jgi:two-component system chemotaxis response regulator CheV